MRVSWNFRLFGLTIIAAALWLAAAVPALADSYECGMTSIGPLADISTPKEIRHFVRCAVQHVESVGWEQALEDFHSDSRWVDGSIYLFGMNSDAISIFNASGVTSPGDDRSQAQDADGQFHVQRMLHLVRNFGGGYVNYRFHNPDTGVPGLKLAYVHPVETPHEGDQAWLGAGVYPLDTRGACSPDRVRASLVYSLDDARKFVKCFEIHLRASGLQALHDLIGDERWVSGPAYLFLLDQQTGVQIASGGHPALNGQNLMGLTDSTGFEFIRHGLRFADLFGEAVLYYEYDNPATGLVEPKTSYVRQLEVGGHPYVLGMGVYMPARDSCRSMPRAADVDTKAELENFVQCASDLIAERGRAAFDLFLHHRTWRSGQTYIYVGGQQCQDLVYPLQYRVDEENCELVDEEGTPVNQNILDIANSESGRGYTSYIWMNPASGQVERKTSYVIGQELEGEIVSVLAGLYGLEE